MAISYIGWLIVGVGSMLVIGKHLLKIDVFNQDILLEHIEAVVDVGLGGYDYEDRLAGVNILLRW